MDELISRQAAINVCERVSNDKRHSADGNLGAEECRERIMKLPPIQPDNGLQSLAEEIASFKRCFNSENGDYLTGYLSALSVVEGMIADMREVTT